MTTPNILQPKRQKKLWGYLFCLCCAFHNSPLDGSLTALWFCISLSTELLCCNCPRRVPLPQETLLRTNGKTSPFVACRFASSTCPPKPVYFNFLYKSVADNLRVQEAVEQLHTATTATKNPKPPRVYWRKIKINWVGFWHSYPLTMRYTKWLTQSS